MRQDITIRQATIDDISGILSLYRQPEMDGQSTISEARAKELFHTMALYPSYHFYVAYVDKQAKEETSEDIQLVGVFGLLVMDNFGHQGAPSAVIEGVCVAEHSQGQGIGKVMMQAAHDICRDAGCYKMTLSSNLRRKDAHRFYENLGFKQHGLSYYIDIT